MSADPIPDGTAATDTALAAAKSLDYAHLKDIARLGDKAREEAWAKNHSMPTRLLGWMLIGGFCLEVASGFSGNHSDLGGIVFLICGIAILRGSQSGLRFVTVLFVPASLAGIVTFAHSLVSGHPIEVGNKWVNFRDPNFWLLGVCPLMFLIAESILAGLAFKFRRIPFWTKTVKVWSGILGAIVTIQMAFAAVGLWRNHTIRRDFPRELEAIREHVDTFGSYSTTSSLANADKLARRIPRIREASWRSPNGQAQVLQRRSRATTHGMRPAGSPHEYSEWYQTKSGEWGRLEMQVILRKAP